MSRRLQAISILIFMAVAIGGVGFRHAYVSPFLEERRLEVQEGMGAYEVVQALSNSPLKSWVYLGFLSLSGHSKHLQVGEYCFPPGLSLQDIFESLAQGKHRVAYRLQVIEGMTVREVMDRLQEAPQLKGSLGERPREGALYPDTYTYYKGDSRQVLLQLMQRRMSQVIDTLWARRDPSCTLKNPGELLILASLVEKETSLAQERPRVAGVYLTRLGKGMALQADPTVVYGLSEGRSKLDHPLTKADLRKPHAYNTYLNRGLPPTAIAIPSRESLEAVAHPEITGELYFVARGQGGHAFSKTLKDHQRHHQALRQWRKRALRD